MYKLSLLFGCLLLLTHQTKADSEILQWNQILLDQIASHSIPPPKAAEYMAILHVCQREALMTVAYFTDMSIPMQHCKAASAGYYVLTSLFGQSVDFSSEYSKSIQFLSQSQQARCDEIGSGLADAIILSRDLSNPLYTSPFTPPVQNGIWRPTGPAFAAYLLPNWGQLPPWNLDSGSQFLPPVPPKLNELRYNQELEEVMEIGNKTSSLRTAEQSDIAKLWSAGPGTVTPPGQWCEVAQQLLAGETLWTQANTFAKLGMALSDAAISAWFSKREYLTWRPVTAIQFYDSSLNWSSFIGTPPFPGYVSGHSTFSSVGSCILKNTLGSEIQPEFQVSGSDVTRFFTNLTEAGLEAGMSRIYGGIHFQADNIEGFRLGQAICEQTLNAFSGQQFARDFVLGSSTSMMKVTLLMIFSLLF